jgi:hypothetical protein
VRARRGPAHQANWQLSYASYRSLSYSRDILCSVTHATCNARPASAGNRGGCQILTTGRGLRPGRRAARRRALRRNRRPKVSNRRAARSETGHPLLNELAGMAGRLPDYCPAGGRGDRRQASMPSPLVAGDGRRRPGRARRRSASAGIAVGTMIKRPLRGGDLFDAVSITGDSDTTRPQTACYRHSASGARVHVKVPLAVMKTPTERRRRSSHRRSECAYCRRSGRRGRHGPFLPCEEPQQPFAVGRFRHRGTFFGLLSLANRLS